MRPQKGTDDFPSSQREEAPFEFRTPRSPLRVQFDPSYIGCYLHFGFAPIVPLRGKNNFVA